MGAVAWAIRHRSVSHPRSSNRTCPIKASGSPVGFTEGHTGSEPIARGICTVSNSPSFLDTATSDSSGLRRCCQAYRQSPRPPHLRKHAKSQGPLLRRHYPASTLLRPCPTPAMAVACRDVEAATLAPDGPPPITRTTFPTCRAHYPGGSSGCVCRLLPRSCSLPQMAGGSASALSLSRPAQASLALRPVGLLSRPKATFVTRLQPFRLPGRAARQLPDQSTTIRVESSSTGDSRLRGALPIGDISMTRGACRTGTASLTPLQAEAQLGHSISGLNAQPYKRHRTHQNRA
jgi:hypothetical protein